MKKEEILKIYQTYRLYIFPSGVVLSCLILIFFVVYPQTVKLLETRKLEGQVLDRHQLLEVKAQNLESFDGGDLTKKVEYAVSSYPTQKDFVSAVGVLQDLTAESGFGAATISLGSSSPKQSATVQSYGVRVEVIGPAVFLGNLLTNIENSPRLMRISSIEVTSGRDEQSAAIALSIDVLYSATEAGLGSIDSPLPVLSEEEEQIITRLSQSRIQPSIETTTPAQLGLRGKPNPFE